LFDNYDDDPLHISLNSAITAASTKVGSCVAALSYRRSQTYCCLTIASSEFWRFAASQWFESLSMDCELFWPDTCCNIENRSTQL